MKQGRLKSGPFSAYNAGSAQFRLTQKMRE